MLVDLARPRPSRRAVVAVALGPPALFVAWSWSAATEGPLAWALALGVAACLAVTAMALMGFDRTAALWVEVAAVCWVFGGLAPRASTPWTAVSDAAWVGLWLSLAWALVSYPGDAPIRPPLARLWSAVFVVTTGCAMVAAAAARQSPLWWASALVPLAVGLSVGTLLVVRVLGVSSVHRTLLRPVVVTTLTAATMTWLLWLTAGDPRSGVDLVAWLAQCLLVAFIPVSVAVVAARRRLARVVVAGLLDELASPPTVAGVQAVLRRVLRDPSATVLIPLPGSAGDTQADGTTAEPPNSAQRLVMQVVGAAFPQDTAADTIALVHLDASLAIDLPRIEAAVVTCGPALANARLHEVNRIRLRELHRTRARVVAAALEERRRLGRNLHDGAQGALVGVSMQLSAIRSRVTDRNSMQVLDEARDQVRAALTDLRVLTQDLYPAGLAGEGLGAALEAALDEQQMDVTLCPPTERYDADVETVAYLTVLDLLTGLARHRHATSAQLSLTREGRDLVITIGHGTDPGDAEGPWLTAVADRLRAMGGDLQEGRCDRPGPADIEARIPCE